MLFPIKNLSGCNFLNSFMESDRHHSLTHSLLRVTGGGS